MCWRGGVLRCCSFSVTRMGGTPMFVSSTLRGDCSLFFILLFGLRLAFVYCSGVLCLLPCSGISFSCCSLPLRLSSGSFFPFLVFCGVCLLFRLSCLYLVVVRYSHVSFFSLGVCLFLVLPTYLLPESLLSLLSFLQLSWGLFFFSFLAVGSGLFCLFSSLCSPFFAVVALRCGGSSLRMFRVSGFN